MNDAYKFDVKSIDYIVWIIPFKKLRDAVRNILLAIYIIYRRTNMMRIEIAKLEYN